MRILIVYFTLASTVSSMWGSMTTSMQLAQECLLQDKGEDIAKPVEGLESFAETIDSGFYIHILIFEKDKTTDSINVY